ncbi:flagellar filament capping protein FliD [Leeia oryzae]|uniref:flagellar filament capping protein FliD n=1 Tax=Leeia oryzae TaxID=356662 RepID=UPI00036CF06C|nr:flagellar filament capping protein FliD [Leeia oryzae]
MSNNNITDSGITRFLLNRLNNEKLSSLTAGAASTNPQVSFAAYMAGIQSQVMGQLTGSSSADSSGIDAITGAQTSTTQTSATNLLSMLNHVNNVHGLLAPGRIKTLKDPESGYQMMSIINQASVQYKAQFAELDQMKTAIGQLQQQVAGLSGITTSTDNATIKSNLQACVDQYNNWVDRFGPDVKKGGVLANVQAAEVALNGLNHTLKDRFYGASDGLHGLSDLGLTIDPQTGHASLDTTKLDATLTNNKQGTVDALQAFSERFDKVSDRLTADHNFLSNRMDNLNRAIQYIDDHQTDLAAEFGTGDTAAPTGALADALAWYQQHYGKPLPVTDQTT